jgi:hypothetical protein
MAYYLCPRCGGTESFGQWEQNFRNTSTTVYDNYKQPIGSTNLGMGVSNIRQQYCVTCLSVKMDIRYSPEDLNNLVNLILGIGKMMVTIVSLTSRLILRTAPFLFIVILLELLFLNVENLDSQLSFWYLPVNLSVSLLMIFIVENNLRLKFKRGENRVSTIGFLKFKLSLGAKIFYSFAIIVQVLFNFIYLKQLGVF